MLNPLGHDKHLADVKSDRAIAHLDVEDTLEHEEKIVRLVMLMPMKRPFELGDHDVVVVVGRNSARGEAIGECRELIGEIGGYFHGFSQLLGLLGYQWR